jgi:hypothetical protein
MNRAGIHPETQAMSDWLSMLGSIVHAKATESTNLLGFALALLLLVRWTYALRVPSLPRKAVGFTRGFRRAGSDVAVKHLIARTQMSLRTPAALSHSAPAPAVEPVAAASDSTPSSHEAIRSGTPAAAPARAEDRLGERAVACYS